MLIVLSQRMQDVNTLFQDANEWSSRISINGYYYKSTLHVQTHVGELSSAVDSYYLTS